VEHGPTPAYLEAETTLSTMHKDDAAASADASAGSFRAKSALYHLRGMRRMCRLVRPNVSLTGLGQVHQADPPIGQPPAALLLA
jgi:hypothetical protein